MLYLLEQVASLENGRAADKYSRCMPAYASRRENLLSEIALKNAGRRAQENHAGRGTV